MAEINPFRYRGYYYDVETDLYYLQSRYYDPETGRFLNSDAYSYLSPETLNGLNLYAYCGNNPVMRVDPNGKEWWEFWRWDWAKIGMITVSVLEIIGGIVLIVATQGAALGTGIGLIGTGIGSIISGVVNENNGGSFWAGWAGSQVGGLISLIPVVGPALGGFAGSVVSDVLNKERISWSNAFLSAGISLLFGKISATFDLVASEIVQELIPQIVNGLNSFVISILNIIIDTFKGKLKNEKKLL